MTRSNKKRHRTKSEDNSNKKQNLKGSTLKLRTSPLKQGLEQTNMADPEITLKDINTSLKDLTAKVGVIELNQNKLDQALAGTGGIQEKLLNLDSDTGENTALIKIQDKHYLELKSEVDQLKALVSKQSQQISTLQLDNDELRNRSMRSNVLLHNIKEYVNENCENTIVTRLNKSGMVQTNTLVFERVHRIGLFNTKAKTPRPIVAKLISSKDTERILQHGKTLPKEKGELRITPQFTPMLKEKRNALGAVAKRNEALG